MDRRRFLRQGVAGAAGVLLAGCATRTGPDTTPTTPSTPSSSPPGTVAAASWAGLAAGLAGRLVLPADAGYLRGVQLFDPRFDSVRPAAVAYCATPGDVQRCLAFARAHGLTAAARSGGHSYAGYSTVGGGLVIDVTGINHVSATGTSATVGAGARLIDVYTALNRQGVSIPAGSCPTVGIAGLTLGGGVGVVDRLYGLTCDSLTAVQLVTADGRLVTADAGTDGDLLWASQGGGGGNFGVVTSLTFRTFPTTAVTLFALDWPWSAAAQVLPAWMEWAPAAPDPLWSNLVIETQPGAAGPHLHVSGVWVGTPAAVAPLLDRLVSRAGTPASSRSVSATDFGRAMYIEGGCASLSQSACHLQGQSPAGALARQPSLARSAFVNAPFGPAGVAAVIAGIDEQQAAGRRGAAGFDACGGAINRVAPTATAFVHRRALCSAQYSVPFDVGDGPAVLAAGQRWLDAWYASLRPYGSGEAYQNYIDPALPDWATAYYGANLGRLRHIKRVWDPDNVFHFAQSIPPGP